ncbi:MAG: MlaD family protein [Thermoguttaceae bacterium]|jgi:phospholipid/cholesterol/gamma-HCH transport system substrate-binding protein
MNERTMQFRVGVMVLATLIFMVSLVVWFGGWLSLSLRTYTIKIRFPEAPNVSSGTPIRKSGICIGRVRNIDFDDQDTAVLVTAEIYADRHVYHNEECRLVSSILMGDAVLEFVRSTDPNLPATPVEPGERLRGVVAPDPTRAVADLQQGLSNTIGSVSAVSQKMQAVLGRLDNILGSNEERISKTLQLLQDTLGNANGVLGDPQIRAQLKESMREMPLVLDDTRTAITSLGSLAADLKKVTESGQSVIQRIDQSTEKLDRVMDEMLRFSQDLNNPQGSLGQLLHDREFYQHLSHSARNMEEVTRELRPILDDVRSFTDKISRHPEVLGVRGAIQRNSGMK